MCSASVELHQLLKIFYFMSPRPSRHIFPHLILQDSSLILQLFTFHSSHKRIGCNKALLELISIFTS